MGCVASKLEEEEEVVSICRERKRLLKLAVERRYALAESHCRYCKSLYAVAAAIKLFVARHSSPSSPFLITFPPPCPPSPPSENLTPNPRFLQQAPSEPTGEAMACGSSTVSSSGSECSEECQEDLLHSHRQEHEQEQSCGYYFMPMSAPPPMVQAPPMASPQRDFGWDFFNPFDGMRPEVIGGYQRSLDDDLRVVREQEGIPELEEEGDREEEEEEEQRKAMVGEENGAVEDIHGAEMVKPVDDNVSQVEQKGLTVMDSPEKGRELLEALKDIEDYFIRAYDSGKDVSKMLEANRVHLQSGLEEIRENSTKLIQAITWHRSTSSCKSLVASSSKSSSTWSEGKNKNDLFDDYGGMTSGSHSQTLGRLYAWEKKLFEEVKAGDSTRKIYEKKCSRLRNQDVRGDDEFTMDKTRVSVKDLYARILVAIRSAESISKRIQKLRDEELQPQIVELLKGLTQTWKIMSESHETQNKILKEVKSFACPSYGKFCNDSHRLATLQLEAELQNWRACFADYITTQRAYVEALNGWLSKFLVPEVEFYSRGKHSAGPGPYRVNGPPLLVICHDWLGLMEKLPEKAVTCSLKSFAKDVRALWAQQGKEKDQKRKVESLAKELDKRVLGFQKTENRFLHAQVTDSNAESDAGHGNEHVIDKKEHLEMFRRRLDMEKEKHYNHVQETQRITLNGFQTGFCSVFESLTEFSKALFKMYNDLVVFSENAEKVSFIEGSGVEDGSR